MPANMLDVFDQRFVAAGDKTALVTGRETLSYVDLQTAISDWGSRIDASGIAAGDTVLLKGDFGKAGIGALFALFKVGAIVILIAPSSAEKEDEFGRIGSAQWRIECETSIIQKGGYSGEHPLYDELRSKKEPGIVLFSSGSTGTSKGAVHSATKLLEKFRPPGKDFRTLAFLLFDHIAGLDTLFYSLSNASALILPDQRRPEDVCRMIEAYKVEVLPTAPSFLNLLLLSGAIERYDLSSLKIITYGSEMMSEPILARLADALPNVRLIQKYGTSETGAMPSRSRSNQSTWVKLGGDGFQWRVVDGLFEVQSKTAMLGYLNAEDPFTEDGWFKTGDRVEVDGDYVRFLGRDSDIINVGGQKVYPAEVEAIILEMPEVVEVVVYGEPHAILGAVVVAGIRPVGPGTPAQLRRQVRQHLSGRVEAYKIPQKFKFDEQPLVTDRFKSIRKSTT